VRDGARGDLRDLVHHALRLGDTALPIRHEHAVVRRHKQADRRELLGSGGSQLFVRVHALGELLNAREISGGEPAFDWIARAHYLTRGGERRHGHRNQNSYGHAANCRMPLHNPERPTYGAVSGRSGFSSGVR
jgi:hypothetical protein